MVSSAGYDCFPRKLWGEREKVLQLHGAARDGLSGHDHFFKGKKNGRSVTMAYRLNLGFKSRKKKGGSGEE